MVDPAHLNTVVQGMFGVVNEAGGTAGAARLPGIEVCGKTGTAQLASNERQKATNLGELYRDNAWFVGFAPRSAPEIVVAVLFENGLHGNFAAPMAREVIRVYFEKKTSRTAPSQPVARVFGLKRPDGSLP
jgi:penicillin-binding protein 2